VPSNVKVVFYRDRLASQISEKVIVPFMTLVGAEYSNGVKERMRRSPATGRVYRRGKKTHRASSPGQAPRVDTGDLVKSVRFQLRKSGSKHIMEAGSNRKKAVHLEYGAARLSKKAPLVRRRRKQTGREARWILFPRPSWGPEMQTLRSKMPALMARASKMKRRK